MELVIAARSSYLGEVCAIILIFCSADYSFSVVPITWPTVGHFLSSEQLSVIAFLCYMCFLWCLIIYISLMIFQALAEKDVGEVIIRPSSKGPSHLSMTLKFYDGVYVNIDIVEGGKDSRDMTSFLRIGKTLTIGDDTFEDLDEVCDSSLLIN